MGRVWRRWRNREVTDQRFPALVLLAPTPWNESGVNQAEHLPEHGRNSFRYQRTKNGTEYRRYRTTRSNSFLVALTEDYATRLAVKGYLIGTRESRFQVSRDAIFAA